MVRFSARQFVALGQTLRELANLAAVALAFGQFVGQGFLSWGLVGFRTIRRRHAVRHLILRILAGLFAVVPATALAQSPKAATYITDEEIKKVNSLPGVDRQIVSVDIGKLNEAVGVIHRGPTGPAARGAAPAAGGGGRGAAAPGEPCGQQITAPPAGAANGIAHDGQTETYVIISGGGTLVTGGHIANGRRSAPDSDVTRILNGPSCSGIIAGLDIVSKQVKTGDLIIIPAGVPHGWSEIPDHVDYLSVRPDPDRVLPRDYVNPALKK
jgi:mannose-6-phosphate isomerase-like protein (cupin superfamily)